MNSGAYTLKRLGAFAIDYGLIWIVSSLLTPLIWTLLLRVLSEDILDGLGYGWWFYHVIGAGIPVALLGVSTGLWGVTPGKLVCFLRVKRRYSQTKSIGIANGLLREFVKLLAAGFMFAGFFVLYELITKQKTFYDDWLNADVYDLKPIGLTEAQKNWRKHMQQQGQR